MEFSIVIKPRLGFLFQATFHNKLGKLHWTFQNQISQLAMENGLGLKLYFRIEHGDIPTMLLGFVFWVNFSFSTMLNHHV